MGEGIAFPFCFIGDAGNSDIGGGSQGIPRYQSNDIKFYFQLHELILCHTIKIAFANHWPREVHSSVLLLRLLRLLLGFWALPWISLLDLLWHFGCPVCSDSFCVGESATLLNAQIALDLCLQLQHLCSLPSTLPLCVVHR